MAEPRKVSDATRKKTFLRWIYGNLTCFSQEHMIDGLEAAQEGVAPFDANAFVGQWPAKAHDHFLIPAGTVHCSGAGCMWCSLRVIVVLGGYCTAAQSCYVEPLHYRGADTSIS